VKYRFTNPFAPGRALHSGRMLQLLEVTKLPLEGMPARMLPGIASDGKPVEIRVWVAVHVPKFRKDYYGRDVRVKSSSHRVRCACPGCGAELSAGRLFQHVCAKGNDRALESVRTSLGFAPHVPTYTCECTECRAARATPSNPHGYVSRKELD
jgi:hypothetical protein